MVVTAFQMYNHLLDDPSSQGIEIYYRCVEFDAVSNMCKKPLVYVNTRTHPEQFTSSQRDDVNTQVNEILSGHCINMDSLHKTVYRSDLPPCNPTVPQGYLNLE